MIIQGSYTLIVETEWCAETLLDILKLWNFKKKYKNSFKNSSWNFWRKFLSLKNGFVDRFHFIHFHKFMFCPKLLLNEWQIISEILHKALKNTWQSKLKIHINSYLSVNCKNHLHIWKSIFRENNNFLIKKCAITYFVVLDTIWLLSGWIWINLFVLLISAFLMWIL